MDAPPASFHVRTVHSTCGVRRPGEQRPLSPTTAPTTGPARGGPGHVRGADEAGVRPEGRGGDDRLGAVPPPHQGTRERLPGLTIVIIEHEMGVIERVTDRCVVLNYGRKIKEGTFAQVAGDRQVQEAYLGVA